MAERQVRPDAADDRRPARSRPSSRSRPGRAEPVVGDRPAPRDRRRGPDRRRLRADGRRSDADLRRHGHHQHRAGRDGHARRVPQLRAVGAPRDRAAPRTADHGAGDVRARRRDRVLLHAPAAGLGPDRNVDPRHVRGGDRDRGDPQRRLRRRLRAAARLLRRQVGARARLLPALHLPDRIRPGGRAAGGALLAALPHEVRARGPRLAAEPHRGRPDRDQRQPHAHDLGRASASP